MLFSEVTCHQISVAVSERSLSKHPRKLSKPRGWHWSPAGERAEIWKLLLALQSWQGLPWDPQGGKSRGKSSESSVEHSWGWGRLPPPPADTPELGAAGIFQPGGRKAAQGAGPDYRGMRSFLPKSPRDRREEMIRAHFSVILRWFCCSLGSNACSGLPSVHTVKRILGEDAIEGLGTGKYSSQASLELETSALSFPSPPIVWV